MNSASPQRRAVIDVGTNSVKLLVADVAGSDLTLVAEESHQTRLGAGFYATHTLQHAAIAKTAGVVEKYAVRAAHLAAASIRLIATSAARDARNAGDLTSAIRQASGLEMEILTGEDEAQWVFRGVTSDPKLAQRPVLVLDVGGGSTEFIVGESSVPQFCCSSALGAVRLLEQLQPGDPPGWDALQRCRAVLKSFLDEHVAPALEPALARCGSPAQLVGTGGSATTLACIEMKTNDFNREKIEATPLAAARVRSLVEEQWQMSLAERQKIPGLPKVRADIMLTGAAIYEAIMTRFGFAQLQPSTRGLRYWALLQPHPAPR